MEIVHVLTTTFPSDSTTACCTSCPLFCRFSVKLNTRLTLQKRLSAISGPGSIKSSIRKVHRSLRTSQSILGSCLQRLSLMKNERRGTQSNICRERPFCHPTILTRAEESSEVAKVTEDLSIYTHPTPLHHQALARSFSLCEPGTSFH